MARRSSFPRLARVAPQFSDNLGNPAVVIAPWVGPNGEIVLIARDSRGRRVREPYEVPLGTDHVAAGDMMWDWIIAEERRARLI